MVSEKEQWQCLKMINRWSMVDEQQNDRNKKCSIILFTLTEAVVNCVSLN